MVTGDAKTATAPTSDPHDAAKQTKARFNRPINLMRIFSRRPHEVGANRNASRCQDGRTRGRSWQNCRKEIEQNPGACQDNFEKFSYLKPGMMRDCGESGIMLPTSFKADQIPSAASGRAPGGD